ncbi:MAG TPA: PleD family two-component system response regulator [Stellaceae bacterium]|nr:PleD family two-component system response regulator [Stellaceae bacterium]
MSARILVVDDIELNVKLLEAKLSCEYYDVVRAYSGPEALAIADAEPPDLVLLDVMMPRMDGFEVCRRLKSNPRTADVPVVMVTALSDVASRVQGLEAGADDFLTKPVNDVALFARLRSLVRLKRTLEEWRAREEICLRLAGPRSAALAPDPGPARILLLEEDAMAAARMAEMLRPVALEVVRVTSYAGAQKRLPEAEVLIASMTPTDDAALRLVSYCRATESLRQMSILLIAEEDDLPRLAKGLDIGASDYVIRPVDGNELLARTRTQIRRKRLQDRLRENYRLSLALALTDELTGLYNRRFLFAHLDQLRERIAHGGPGAAVLLFDLDHFRQVNNTYGHAAGDEVLRQLAARVLRVVRDVDLVARLGGDEFVVVMAETPLSEALAIAERLRLAVASEPFTVRASRDAIPLTISIGAAAVAAGHDSSDTLLTGADDCLYRAKNAGRNQTIGYPSEPSSAAFAEPGAGDEARLT